MSHFIIIFDRDHRSEPEIEQIDDADDAMARLFEVERDLKGDPGRGVVLLYADDEESLRVTHGHYFKTLDEILELA
jgi:hypothetical protein